MSLAPRSMLFVSGETPARFVKAVNAGADLVCLDLEDAVHRDNKDTARQRVIEFIQEHSHQAASCPVAVRINALNTTDGLRDIEAWTSAPCQPAAIVLPKTENARDITLIQSWFGQSCPQLIALIESPAGILAAADIASSRAQVPQLLALMLGGVDLCLELGAEFEWQSLLSARSQLLTAARSHGLQAWDVPHINLNNTEELQQETLAVRRLGFDCKTAIHPKQLSIIHSAWRASEEEVNWASALLDEYQKRLDNQSQDLGAFLFEGRMIDEPVIQRARQTLAHAKQHSADQGTPQ